MERNRQREARTAVTQVRPARLGDEGEASGIEVVRLASTANVVPSGTSAVDGVTPPDGSLVLLRVQSVATQRGVWKVRHAGAWRFIGATKFVVVDAGVTYGGGAFWFRESNSTYQILGGAFK